MRILFATDRHYPPHQHGGAQKDMHALVRGSLRRGHECQVVATLPPGRRRYFYLAMRFLTGKRWLGGTDRDNGYPTRRCVPWHLPEALRDSVEQFRPDVVLCDQPELLEHVPPGPARSVRFVDVNFGERPTSLRPGVLVLSNSHFTAGRVSARFGTSSTVVYPIISSKDYRVDRTGAQHVTFVNPRQDKGREIALGVAQALPHRPMLIQESWPLAAERLADLKERIKLLDNIALGGWVEDIRRVYAQTRLLLVPSQCPEAFGRVVVEAQTSGIPVVASDIGGLPEAVGKGGRLVDPQASPQHWAEVVEEILSDENLYSRLSCQAVANANRREFEPSTIVNLFLQMLKGHLERSVTPRKTQSGR